MEKEENVFIRYWWIDINGYHYSLLTFHNNLFL